MSVLSAGESVNVSAGLYAVTRADPASHKRAQEQAFKGYVAAEDPLRQAQYGDVLPIEVIVSDAGLNSADYLSGLFKTSTNTSDN